MTATQVHRFQQLRYVFLADNQEPSVSWHRNSSTETAPPDFCQAARMMMPSLNLMFAWLIPFPTCGTCSSLPWTCCLTHCCDGPAPESAAALPGQHHCQALQFRFRQGAEAFQDATHNAV
eukprot:CAMPEP_0172775970 /NCGR_PEP_ID=MMETSP1074-20121228/199009_1 /TAXON_ID=2916 /ORGANISM="Ceratium fusus, Strain PA161109" /LENGTH=119 /DNA_ID=CAMNT_0013612669 /DNA_START=36 /DNA_END=395 /DNA_ORIENTATION=+